MAQGLGAIFVYAAVLVREERSSPKMLYILQRIA